MLLAAKEEYAREGLPPTALDFEGLDNVKVTLTLTLTLALTLTLTLAPTLTLTLTLALTLTRCGQTRTEGAGCKPSAVHTLAGLAAWSRSTLGSAPAQLLRLLRAHLAALAVLALRVRG